MEALLGVAGAAEDSVPDLHHAGGVQGAVAEGAGEAAPGVALLLDMQTVINILRCIILSFYSQYLMSKS